MERTRFLRRLALMVLTPLFFIACTNEKETVSSQNFTCPMHPQIIKDGPSSCPICGMDLVPVSEGGTNNEIILMDSQVQLANITTMPIASSNFGTSKVLNARLLTNPELSELISSRYAGRIERLYVKETGRQVSKGQALFQIYSEELQTLQQDYLLQLKQSAAFPNEKIYTTLREAAKNKLRLFGYSNTQISNLARSSKTSPLITVNATVSGVVNELNVSEGQYVSAGSPIISLENYSQLWVEADVYPDEASSIKIGTPVKVRIDGFPELEQTVKINFISPQIDAASQVLKVRGPISSQGKLQSGMQATVLLNTANISNAVALPLSAVVRDGKGAHVWVKTGKNTFAPKMVTTGQEDANQIIITSGLEKVKEVVVSGAYLLSSEFILKKGSDAMSTHDMSKM